MTSLTCPSCKGDTIFEMEEDIEESEGSTADCSWCNLLILIKDGKAVDFHKEMNQQDSRWPADGKSTSIIDLPV